MAELIWDGKYDSNGARTAPLRVALPFQTVETVNESVQDRQRSLDLFGGGKPTDWRNRLIWGDKKYVLPALADEFAGQVDLIYIDPPFFTGDNFAFRVFIDGGDFEKEPSIIEQKAYRDTWGKGTDGYLQWFYETAVLLHTLLAGTGSIVVHLDWHIGHYAKTVLDDVFGIDQFRNEIAWCYGGGGAPTNYYHRKHDTLFWYSKGSRWTFNVQRRPYTEGTRQRGLTAVKGPQYELHEEGAALDDWWSDCQKILSPTAYENLKFPTQKPESLLNRIVLGHTNPDAVVLDCFVGSGTTAAHISALPRRQLQGLSSPTPRSTGFLLSRCSTVEAPVKRPAGAGTLSETCARRDIARDSVVLGSTMSLPPVRKSDLRDETQTIVAASSRRRRVFFAAPTSEEARTTERHRPSGRR